MTDDQVSRGAPTWYDVLGLERGVSAAEIRAAWREATDRATPGSSQFRAANQAAETLLDPERRAAYDATIDGETPPRQATPAVATASAGARTESPAGSTGSTTSDSTADPRSWRDRFRRGDRTEHRSAAAKDAPVGRVVRVLGAAPLWALLLLVVLLVGAGVVVAVLGLRVQAEARVADARLQAPVAAEEAATAMLSYDYRTLPEDRARAERFLTGDFKDSYLESFVLLEEQQDGTAGPAVQSKAVVQAQVMGSGVVDVADDGREARVLVFVNQMSEKEGQDPQVFQNRVAMSLEEADGRWLVADLRSY